MWGQIGAFKTRSIRCLACKVSGTKFWVPDEPEIRIRFTDDVNEAGARFRMVHFLGQNASLNMTMFDDPSQSHRTEHLVE